MLPYLQILLVWGRKSELLPMNKERNGIHKKKLPICMKRPCFEKSY